jgi:hypothetical protein
MGKAYITNMPNGRIIICSADEQKGKPMSYGTKAVGLTFNPSGDPKVEEVKQGYADLIDLLDNLRANPEATSEAKRLFSIAITEAQTAQMWAVKAITWKD